MRTVASPSLHRAAHLGALAALALLGALASCGKSAPPGMLAIDVSGLPSGLAGEIAVTGPDGFSLALGRTQLIGQLAPGTYSVAAQPVGASGASYAAAVTGSPAEVAAGESATVQVVYAPVAPTTATLAVAISGLPAGSAADVSVSGPAGFSQHLTASATLAGLSPGSYAISAAAVGADGGSWLATVAGSPALLAAGATANATVVYAAQPATTGALALLIRGLPDGVDAQVSVSGPSSFSASASETVDALAPGSYAITASDISSGGFTWVATIDATPVEVVAGLTAAASITYAASSGALALTISGLPAGASASVGVSGPGGTRSPTASGTLTDLAPGSYAIVAASVASGGFNFTATIDATPVQVVAGETAAASITYATSSGALALTVSGVPSGAAASGSVSGPGSYHHSFSGPLTLSGLAPGNYTIVANPLSAGGESFAATITSTPIAVVAGQTASVAVAYAQTTGTLAITIHGLPYGVTVSGPDGYGAMNLSSPATLHGLVPGSYTVDAQPYDTGIIYSATVTGSPANVLTGQTAQVTIDYAPPPPTVTQVYPAPGGEISGGYPVGIYGSNFATGLTSVSFGGAPATSINVVSSTQLSVIAPAHALGQVDVTVTTPGGTSALSAADRFHYYHVDYFPIPTSGAGQGGVALGADGNLWFAERGLGKVGKATPAGVVTEYALPSGSSDPVEVALGADGNVWYSLFSASRIGSIGPDGTIVEYPLTNGCLGYGIAPGPGGAIWFTALQCTSGSSNKVGNILTSSAHTVTETDLATSTPLPFGMCTGPDGDVWWADYNSGQLGTSSAAGALSAFSTGAYSPAFVAAGPDGNLWFTGTNTNSIASMNTSGTLTSHTVQSGSTTTSRIAADATGLWFAGNGLDYIDASTGVDVLYPLTGTPTGVAVAPDGAVWLQVQGYSSGHGAIARFQR